jgi:signal transduction histidine kinase
MKQKLKRLSQHYVTGLQKYLRQGPRADLQPALGLGRRAVALGLETLELARIHERAVARLELSSRKNGFIKRAESFFAEALAPIVETHRAARQSKIDLNRLNATLSLRTVELAASNRQLQRGIVRRKRVEAALKKSGEHYSKRKKISIELQDEIAQTLLGINVRLVSLKQEARSNTRGLKSEIASTQRLVAKSAKSVRRAAREYGKL